MIDLIQQNADDKELGPTLEVIESALRSDQAKLIEGVCEAADRRYRNSQLVGDLRHIASAALGTLAEISFSIRLLGEDYDG